MFMPEPYPSSPAHTNRVPRLFDRLQEVLRLMIERRINRSIWRRIMEERRSGQRRQGPTRKGDRRKQLDESKAHVERGPERRQTDRRSGIERRASTGNRPSAHAA